MDNYQNRITILGCPVDNVTMAQAVEMIVRRLDGKHCDQVCFVNADCANKAYVDAEYRGVLNSAEMVFADGIGMRIAGKILRGEIRDNVNGTDMFPLLCQAVSGTGRGIYLLGARPGIAGGVADWVEQHHPDTLVSGYHHGYFKPEEELEVIRRIRESTASLLLVAFGAPRQDEWIRRNIKETGVDVALGVGGLFDFYSGRIRRAPLWMRKIGTEWVWRFLQEPGRMWRRYFIGNWLFLLRVCVEKLRKGRSS